MTFKPEGQGELDLPGLETLEKTPIPQKSITELSAELLTRIEIGQLPEDLKAQIKELAGQAIEAERLSRTDVLTELYNKRHFIDQYEKMIKGFEGENRRQHKKSWTVGMFDIDFFKKINDTYGHQIGDLVLREAALYLKTQFRDRDIVARVGGEEFAVILENCTAIDIAGKFVGKGMFDKNVDQVALGFDFTHPDTGEIIRVNFSGGIKDFIPNQSTIKPGEAIVRADEGLYEAKETGRNRIVFEDISAGEIKKLIETKIANDQATQNVEKE